jgi:hypothetical protein
MTAANPRFSHKRAWHDGLLPSISFLFVVVAFASGQTNPPAAGKSVPPATAAVASTPSPEVSNYVGAETCKTCHEEIYNSWEKTPHWKTTLDTKGGPSKQGCEGCHGPGADHVAGGGDKTKIFVFEGKSRQESSARCLSCHGKRVPAGPGATAAVLRLPYRRQGRLCQTLSPPCERGPGAMR